MSVPSPSNLPMKIILRNYQKFCSLFSSNSVVWLILRVSGIASAVFLNLLRFKVSFCNFSEFSGSPIEKHSCTASAYLNGSQVGYCCHTTATRWNQLWFFWEWWLILWDGKHYHVWANGTRGVPLYSVPFVPLSLAGKKLLKESGGTQKSFSFFTRLGICYQIGLVRS